MKRLPWVKGKTWNLWVSDLWAVGFGVTVSNPWRPPYRDGYNRIDVWITFLFWRVNFWRRWGCAFLDKETRDELEALK